MCCRWALAGDPVPGAEYLCLVATHSYTSDKIMAPAGSRATRSPIAGAMC